MFAQQVVDSVFERIKPYVSMRRTMLFLTIILLSSRSGADLLTLDYPTLTFKNGGQALVDAVASARFVVAFPALWIFFYVGPHINHYLAMLAFKINNKLRFIDQWFKDAEADLDLTRDELEERKRNFVVVAKRINVTLESYISVLISSFIVIVIDYDKLALYTLFPIVFVTCLFYIEATSKVLREYARSVYLLRLKQADSFG